MSRRPAGYNPGPSGSAWPGLSPVGSRGGHHRSRQRLRDAVSAGTRVARVGVPPALPVPQRDQAAELAGRPAKRAQHRQGYLLRRSGWRHGGRGGSRGRGRPRRPRRPGGCGGCGLRCRCPGRGRLGRGRFRRGQPGCRTPRCRTLSRDARLGGDAPHLLAGGAGPQNLELVSRRVAGQRRLIVTDRLPGGHRGRLGRWAGRCRDARCQRHRRGHGRRGDCECDSRWFPDLPAIGEQDELPVGHAMRARLSPGTLPPPGGSWPAAARGCDAGQGDELQERNHHTRWVLSATHIA